MVHIDSVALIRKPSSHYLRVALTDVDIWSEGARIQIFNRPQQYAPPPPVCTIMKLRHILERWSYP